MTTGMFKATLVALFCACVGTLGAATEYFVDCNRPDDSGDGLTESTAKRTIQAAIDLTNPAGKDTVTVLPGVYCEGSRRSPAYCDDDFRVVITNHCILRSRDGAAKTVIKGEFGSDTLKQGAGAVRGVYMKDVSYAVVEGFTLTGCATRYVTTSGDKQYGAAVVGNWNNYLLGCVVSNNWSSAAAGVHNVNVIRCLIADNHAANQAVGHNAYYFNCVITRNEGASSCLASYAKSLANCTCVDNSGTLFDGNAANVRNSVITLLTTVGSASSTELFDCVTDAPASQFKTVGGNSVCGASRYQHVAPALGDWRLQAGSAARGIASLDEYKKLLNTNQKFRPSVDTLKYNPQWILDKYELKDFAGNDMTETLDAGAIQGGVTVASGPVVFANGYACGEDWNIPCGYGSYAFAETWPSSVAYRIVPYSGLPLFFCWIEGMYGTRYHYPTLDGRIVHAMPPSGGAVTNYHRAAQSVCYVSETGSDENSGADADHPFQTLQRAYDAASGNYCYVRVAPGTYDKGGALVNEVSNRLACAANKSIQFVATGGPEVTFVKGAADSGSAMDGMGPAAVRCVWWQSGHNEAAMRGFTFVDGHTTAAGVAAKTSWVTTEQVKGGAVYATTTGSGKVRFLDCVFSGNVSHLSAAVDGGLYTRCRFYKNRSYHASGSVGRAATYAFCEFRDNEEQGQNVTLDNSTHNLYFCSARGRVAPMQSDIYASLLTGMNGLSADNAMVKYNHIFAGNVVNGVTVTKQAGTSGEFSYVSDDARLLDGIGTGFRFLADSPAVGAADVDGLNLILAEVTADLDGHGLFTNANGILTAGAHQWPMQAFVFAGPKDSVTGANVGTNVLEVGESIVLTAAPTRRGVNFHGWTVDDVEVSTEASYVYTAPETPTAAVPVILACYEKPGFLLLFR